MSLSFISLVIPFLSDGSVDLVLFKTVQHDSADRFGSFDQWRKRVDSGTGINFLVILNEKKIYLSSIIKDSGFCLGARILLVSGEENEFINILNKSVFIAVKRFLTSVLATVIDRDSN